MLCKASRLVRRAHSLLCTCVYNVLCSETLRLQYAVNCDIVCAICCVQLRVQLFVQLCVHLCATVCKTLSVQRIVEGCVCKIVEWSYCQEVVVQLVEWSDY